MLEKDEHIQLGYLIP